MISPHSVTPSNFNEQRDLRANPLILWLVCFKSIKKVLIANKMDMPDEVKVVDSARGKALAEQHGLQFFETSAKSG